MKENNLNRVIGWSGLLLTSLLSTSALADNIGTSAEELGLSDYRHFVIYPRLDKALKAQKNNDEYSAAIFLIPICISFDTAEKRRYATYLILNRRFSFEF